MIKIVYKDIAVGSRETFEPYAESAHSISHIDEISLDGIVYPSFASVGELNEMILDGSRVILPDDTSGEYIGLWSNAVSDADGCFESVPTLTLTADGLYTSQGITLGFDENYAAEVNIKWYRYGELLSDMDFLLTESEYFCQNKVESYDEIVVSFVRSALPHRRIKLRCIVHGCIRAFTGRELADVSVIQECSPISAELAINTLDFTLVGDGSVDYVFSSQQPLELYSNSDLLGVFFVSEYDRVSERFYSVGAEDYIGLLDSVRFAGGIYVGRNACELLALIFDGAGVPFEIDSTLTSATVTGWLPMCSCREAARQICFAIGAAVDTTRSAVVRIFEPSNDIVHSFAPGEVMQGLKLTDRQKKLTEVRLTVHGYAEKTEETTAYKASDDGVGDEIFVEFSEPLHSLAITDGEIIEAGANHAVINAWDGCVLTGCGYTHTTYIRTKKNPIVNAGDPQNVVSISDMTLISASNADERLAALYEYYITQGSITGELVMSGQRPCDTVEIATPHDGTVTARIESTRYKLYGGAIVAEVSAR